MSDVSTTQRQRTRQRAFTLVELLVVIAIIAVLTALLLAVLGHTRKGADSVECVANLRQIGTAIAAYVTDHEGTMPGPLTMKQGVDEGGSAEGSLARLLGKYLAPSGRGSAGTAAAQSAPRHDFFLCPAAARDLRGRQTPTYLMNMIPVPGFNQPAWGDAALQQDPLRMTALTNWSDARIDGRPMTMAELWMIKDADQLYFEEIGDAPEAVQDLPPTPAHGDHRNALFHDFHVARVKLLRIVITITPEEPR